MSEKSPAGSCLTISEEIFASFNQTAKKHHGHNFIELVSKSPEKARHLLAHFIIESAKSALAVVNDQDLVVVNRSDDGQEATINFARHLSQHQDIYLPAEDIVVNVVREPSLLGKFIGHEQKLLHSVRLNRSTIAD